MGLRRWLSCARSGGRRMTGGVGNSSGGRLGDSSGTNDRVARRVFCMGMGKDTSARDGSLLADHGAGMGVMIPGVVVRGDHP